MTTTMNNTTMKNQPSLVRLSGAVQAYGWGSRGPSGMVATLAASGAVRHAPHTGPADPAAELWIGTHPGGPAAVYGPSSDDDNHDDHHKESDGDSKHAPLSSLLDAATLSPELLAAHGPAMPFLLKVLAVAAALSIQAHPDKHLARSLHAAAPALYRDDNHKPEMAIALSPFEALVGFRPLTEIARHLVEFPELARAAGGIDAPVVAAFLSAAASSPTSSSSSSSDPSTIAANKLALKNLFKAIMTHPQDDIVSLVTSLITRISPAVADAGALNAIPAPSIESLLVRLNTQFPGDVGIFGSLLLNHVVLNPGQAIFLAANEPHAYLSGDCVECMATSDNVVRAGLTPKHKDVDTLTSMLTYNYGPVDAQILHGDAVPGANNTRLYDPPIDEFSVAAIRLSGEAFIEPARGVHGPSIFLVTEGSGRLVVDTHAADPEYMHVSTGFIVFVPADVPVKVHRDTNASHLVVFRAYCEP